MCKLDQPYTEKDVPNPLNWYGQTKLLSEWGVLRYNPDALILRTSYLYNFKYGIVPACKRIVCDSVPVQGVFNQYITPTHAVYLANQILHILNNRQALCGVVHAACRGHTTPYKLLEILAKRVGVQWVEPTAQSLEASNLSGVCRPARSMLENTKLKSLGLDIMPNWYDGLELRNWEG